MSTLRGLERTLLLKKLHDRYGHATGFSKRFIYWRKKYCWLALVKGTQLLKRFVDIVVSITLMIFLSPLIFLTVILIKLTDNGPILYTTKRVGKWGGEFNFHKFRTMKIGSDQIKGQLHVNNLHPDDIKFKMRNDPRVTWIGKILRTSTFDEVPQLWNVLKGDMSLVGPRPPLPEEVEKYNLEQRRRLDTQPGLTCIWQVSGRSDIPFDQQLKMDIQYIESQSFWLDLKLLIKTIPAILSGRGAY